MVGQDAISVSSNFEWITSAAAVGKRYLVVKKRDHNRLQLQFSKSSLHRCVWKEREGRNNVLASCVVRG